METPVPIFPGMRGESNYLKICDNDLIFELPDYNVVRCGNRIGISLKLTARPIEYEAFISTVSNSEFSKIARLNLTNIETEKGSVVSANLEFYLHVLSNSQIS